MQPETFQTRAGSSNEQHGNSRASNSRTILRTISVIVTAIATAAILVPATHRARAEETTTATTRTVSKFQVGWYDYLSGAQNLPAIRLEGMNLVMPYTDNGDMVAYLNKARETGVDVLVEIDRNVVKTGDPVAVAAWVAKYKANPGIAGWYLADEPSINETLGYPSPATLEKLYQAIKAEDPTRPVHVAFSSSSTDDLTAYANSYDVAMWDDYPCKKYQLEFTNMDAWIYRLQVRSAAAASKQGWIPIIQGFQANAFRLPTANELRFMTYASVQNGATGIVYWAHYRSTQSWIDGTLKPLMSEVRRLAPAFANGPVPNASSVKQGPNVVSKTYRDPATGKYVMVVVNNGTSRVDAKIALAATLGVTIAKYGSTATRIDQGILGAALQRYEVRVYDLS
jgi:hypothetical protein